jgi:uridylate kinase
MKAHAIGGDERQLKVMDATASRCPENRMPIIVFSIQRSHQAVLRAKDAQPS